MKINKQNIFLYLAVILLLVFLYHLGVLKPVENILSKTSNPVIKNFYSFSSNLRLKYGEQADKTTLLERIDLLEKELVRLTEENVHYKTVEEENNALREHLMFLDKAEHDYILANVISRGSIDDINKQTQIITIDKGKEDRIIPGLAMVSSKGVIVGKVFDVKENISQAYLINSPKCKLAVTIVNSDKTSGILEGNLGLTTKMGFIPQDRVINKNDLVITSGLEKLIPRGLIIGSVMDVDRENNELWQSAIVDPIIDVDELLIVSVLLPDIAESL